ncbi:MAG TPA: glycoside hydrolase family 3 N-terminal domain-containing protein [Anaerolineales bacterium]|nr:glycoside hydrolase family 3 N-terminal domain-containing protein [Anaerolineales bacterium]
MLVLLPTGFARLGRPQPDAADVLLAAMSPEERVGQLFLLTFDGPHPPDAVMALLRQGLVSGVVLSASDDNFVVGPDGVVAAEALIQDLQAVRADALRGDSTLGTPSPQGVYVPLIIGMSLNLEGTSYPEFLDGLSEPVTPMALGATWDPSLAEAVGRQTGRELAALGFNLVLGPSLDVLEDSSQRSAGDLGTEVFGGDPFWVSQLGSAFVRGLHAGGQGTMAVIAKHFPGTGGSDRPPSEEVATVRKSLEGLRLVDLAPFFAVTTGVPGQDPGTVDGVLLSHIRYQGLQGSIRQTTRPVSLDRAAVSQILGLDTLPAWRTAGGLVVSDSLGSRAVRRFIDPSEQTFNGPQVAREAFQAGSDLLLLDDFVSSGDPDQATTIRRTAEAFATRYRDDPVFAAQVDEAALRVLRLKLRLYGGAFDVEAPAQAGRPTLIEPSPDLAFEVARRAASRISPAGPLSTELLGLVPTTGQRIVVFTDVDPVRQCSTCPSVPILPMTALQDTINELYGTRAGGQARSWDLTSYSMADLAYALGERPPAGGAQTLADPEDVNRALDGATWVIFNLLSTRDGRYGSDALRLLLDRAPEKVQGKRLVAFAFDVPYELDATDLSKIDLFYALYEPWSSAVNTAARLLYQEVLPEGASPVSVSGVGYDLLEVVSPDPDAKIGLQVRSSLGSGDSATPQAGFNVGDTVFLSTNPILDHNGRAVPDGTPVEFGITYPGESLSSVLQSTTVAGVAQASIRLDRTGLLTIRATSDPARISDIVQLDVEQGVPAFATVIAPTAAPTPTASATDTVISPTAPPGPLGSSGGAASAAAMRLPSGALLLGMLLAAGGGTLAGYAFLRAGADRRDALRAAFIGATGVLVGFDYAALGLPGSAALPGAHTYLSLILFCLVGGAGGTLAARAWWKSGWRRLG